MPLKKGENLNQNQQWRSPNSQKEGRKPKDIVTDVKNNFVQINEETVILHLPIKSKLINLNAKKNLLNIILL